MATLGVGQYLVPFTPINFSSNGDNTVIAGVAGKTIRVLSIFFKVQAAVNITFKDGASNALTGAMPFAAFDSLTFDFRSGPTVLEPFPWFETAPGNAFVMNLSVGTQVSGTVYFTQT